MFYQVLCLLGLLTALLTAMYSFRLIYLVGPARKGDIGEPHHLPSTMLWTLIPLAILGLAGGLLNLPEVWGGNEWLEGLLGPMIPAGEPAHVFELLLGLTAAGLSLAGLLWARWRYAGQPQPSRLGPAGTFFLKGWQADRAIETLLLCPFRAIARFWSAIVDERLLEGGVFLAARSCEGFGQQLRRLTTGRLGHYLTALAFGLGALMVWVLLQSI